MTLQRLWLHAVKGTSDRHFHIKGPQGHLLKGKGWAGSMNHCHHTHSEATISTAHHVCYFYTKLCSSFQHTVCYLDSLKDTGTIFPTHIRQPKLHFCSSTDGYQSQAQPVHASVHDCWMLIRALQSRLEHPFSSLDPAYAILNSHQIQNKGIHHYFVICNR